MAFLELMCYMLDFISKIDSIFRIITNRYSNFLSDRILNYNDDRNPDLGKAISLHVIR